MLAKWLCNTICRGKISSKILIYVKKKKDNSNVDKHINTSKKLLICSIREKKLKDKLLQYITTSPPITTEIKPKL